MLPNLGEADQVLTSKCEPTPIGVMSNLVKQ
jgi:hypothetical protein